MLLCRYDEQEAVAFSGRLTAIEKECKEKEAQGKDTEEKDKEAEAEKEEPADPLSNSHDDGINSHS